MYVARSYAFVVGGGEKHFHFAACQNILFHLGYSAFFEVFKNPAAVRFKVNRAAVPVFTNKALHVVIVFQAGESVANDFVAFTVGQSFQAVCFGDVKHRPAGVLEFVPSAVYARRACVRFPVYFPVSGIHGLCLLVVFPRLEPVGSECHVFIF